MEDNIIAIAYKFASKAHGGQKRKDTDDGFFVHPLRVCRGVRQYAGSTEEMVIAAILHDVLEDTNVMAEEIEERFGSKVAQLCIELVNPSIKHSSLSRVERKAIDREHLKTVSREAKIIKLFDRIDNVTDLRKVHPKRMGWALIYLEESWLLAEVLKDVDESLYRELLDRIDETAKYLFCTSDSKKLASLKKQHCKIFKSLEK